MAAAVILIPEMLSGPDHISQTAPAAAQSRSDAPIKTYTIDLSHSPSSQPPPAVIENRAPPPEELPAASSAAAQPAPDAQAKPEAPQSAPQPVIEQPTAVAPPAPTPQQPLASDRGAPTSGQWAVQVGSYSKEATAERLAKRLRDQGQSAFVMPVKTGGTTLYRVRIGPMKDRASAEAALRELKSPGAAVVPHP